MPVSRLLVRVRALAACALAGLACTLVPAGAARAATSSADGSVHAAIAGVVLRNNETFRCLDSSNAYGLRTEGCNDLSYQNWTFTRKYAGTWEVRSQATGRCLDHSNSAGLRTFACNGSDYQRWAYVTEDFTGSRHLQNAVTKNCLDYSPSHGLRAVQCNGTDYQRWANLGSAVPD